MSNGTIPNNSWERTKHQWETINKSSDEFKKILESTNGKMGNLSLCKSFKTSTKSELVHLKQLVLMSCHISSNQAYNFILSFCISLIKGICLGRSFTETHLNSGLYRIVRSCLATVCPYRKCVFQLMITGKLASLRNAHHKQQTSVRHIPTGNIHPNKAALAAAVANWLINAIPPASSAADHDLAQPPPPRMYWHRFPFARILIIIISFRW